MASVCAAQVCAQIGAYTWPALLPGFIATWGLSNREAGWITGAFYAAYTVAVPLLVTLTDRYDARAFYLLGVGVTAPDLDVHERRLDLLVDDLAVGGWGGHAGQGGGDGLVDLLLG